MKKDYLKYKFKKEYGKDPREFSYRDESKDMIPKVSIYHEMQKENADKYYGLDKITWDDIEMDEVFFRVNHTRSYAGEQMLYHKLHILGDAGSREKIDREAAFFDENEDARINAEAQLYKLGKGYINYHIPEAIDNVEKINFRHKFICPILSVLFFASLILGIVKPDLAGFSVIMGIVNLMVSIYIKMRYEQHLYSMGSFRMLVVCCKNLMKIKGVKEMYSNQEFENSLDNIDKATKKIDGFIARKFAEDSGDTMSVILGYVVGITLIDALLYMIVADKLKKAKSELWQCYRFAGDIDTAISVASFRNGIAWCKPVIEGDSKIKCTALYHPLLENPVTNDFDMEKNSFFTGANASGKSTFMKAVAINVILGESIYTCAADEFYFPEMYVMTSMALRDDVLMGESYYVKEVKYLKRMLEKVESGDKTLIVIDEILKGTNTKERVAASKAVLDYLSEKPAIVLTATHDLELVEQMDGRYDAYYFECSVEENDVKFSYKLHKGKNDITNAINIMKAMGFPEKVVKNAMKNAEETGKTAI